MCVIADDRAVLGFGGILGGEDTGCTRRHQERPDRVRLLRSAAHRRHRPQGRHAERRALPLRARRRSGLHPAGPRPRHRHDAGGGGRHAVQGARSPARRPKPRPSSPSPSALVEKLARHRARREADPRHARGAGLRHRRQGRDREGDRAELAARTSHGAADLVEEVVRIAGLDKVPSAAMPRAQRRGARRADRDAAPRAPRPPRAGGPRPGRGHHLVVHPARHVATAFGGGQDALELANPDLERDDVDAPEPAAGPARRRAAQPQPRLRRRRHCSRSARPIAATRPRTSSSPPRACAPAPRR